MQKKILISLLLFLGVFFGLTGEVKAQEKEIGAYAIDLSIAVSPMNAENASLAGTMLDGVVVNPGEEFSFNDTVGRRTTAKGFSAGYIASQSRSDMAVGGGVCMTASILHQAVKAAGLEVLERHNHCIRISYLPLGEDAAVQYGVQDFRFRNNLNIPVIIRTIVDDRLKIAINIEEKPKNVYFNGSLLKFDTPPVIDHGALLVPAWTMAQTLQGKVSWIAQNQSMVLTKDNTRIVFTVGQSNAWVNGKEKQMGAAVRIINNRTMIPLRFIANELGADLTWNVSSQSASLRMPEYRLAGVVASGGQAVERYQLT
jgi:hypothetical protein